MKLADAFRNRYPHNSDRSIRIRERLETVCNAFLSGGYGDGNTLQRLCSSADWPYWQQLSEVLIATQLLEAGISIEHPRSGPDFVFENAGQKVWVEVICPEPHGLPAEWTQHTPGSVISLPHEAILLRWTAAIKEKAEKLIGSNSNKGYLDKGIVGPQDAYVIAVNGRLVRGFSGAFPELAGISQYPYAVEATLALGPLQILIDRSSLKATGSGYQHRPLIPKPQSKTVPADTFLSPGYAPVSAVWSVDLDEMTLLGEPRPTAVVHNPYARNPIIDKLIPADSEYRATEHGEYFQLERRNGLLAPMGASIEGV